MSTEMYKRYCPKEYEKIENYNLASKDNFIGWVCHHKLGEKHNRKYLRDNKLLYGRPASELIFLRNHEHELVHKLGKVASKETKEKMSKTRKGKKLKPFTKEHIENIIKNHSKSDFYKVFNMTIKEYIKTNNLSCAPSTISRRFKAGKLCQNK